jgi:N utilization substance protein B
MINRELIRIKAVQLLYAYYENEGQTVEAAEKEFLFSLDKAYELYHLLLSLMVSLAHTGQCVEEAQSNRANRLKKYYEVPRKFLDNRFMAQLRDNHQLVSYREKNNAFWDEENEDFLRSTYATLKEQPFFQEYLQADEDNYEADRELWRRIYRELLCNNDELDEILEDDSVYWNDDKAIIDTFVLKTIRQYKETYDSEQPLLPPYKDNEDLKFASVLFRTAIEGEAQYRQLLSEQTRNWDLERVATMDLVIMQAALAEITSFPNIPLSVSINEYVEIAKMYSTPRSSGYINGMLDTVAKRLIAEGKIKEK